MLIHVMYPGNNYDYVKEFILDDLIKTGEIVKFRRSSGWISLGSDHLRAENRQSFFNGVEKRARQKAHILIPHSVTNLRYVTSKSRSNGQGL